MMTPSALRCDKAFALTFRVLKPLPAAPRNLLVLLHGVGGRETDLATLGSAVGPNTVVVMPRGPIALGADAFGWFHVAFASDGPRIVASEAEASRLTLVKFVGQVQATYGIDAQHTVIAGFSQGGILSASVALSAPEHVAGFAVLAGRILPELEPQVAANSRLSELHGFIAHGERDDKLPVDWVHRSTALLTAHGVPHSTRLYPIGHSIDAAMRDDFLVWFGDTGARWNHASSGP